MIPSDIDPFAFGYLIGLIVGEGSFTAGPRLSVAMHVNDPQPLKALRDYFGGKIYGPYTTEHLSGKTTAMLQWQLHGQVLWYALPLLDEHLPASRKRDQYETWKETHREWIAYHQAREHHPNGVPLRIVQEARWLARRVKCRQAKRALP